jgi:HSP20 family protein
MSMIPRSFKDPFDPFFSLAPILPFSGGLTSPQINSGLSIYEQNNKIIVEAQLPGIDPKNVKIDFDRGVLSIKGTKSSQTEDKNKRFFQKSSSSFDYHLHVPGNINPKIHPQANIASGIVKIVFEKQKAEKKPMTISVKPHEKAAKHKKVFSKKTKK